MMLMLPDSVSLLKAMVECVPDELYPPNVLPVPDCIHGTAFLPGGIGLYLEDRDLDEVRFPFGGVMILGHNFDSEAGFKASLERGKEKLNSGTWGSLLPVLNAAEIPLGECFFTNAFMGLCAGNDSLRYEGRKDGAFRSACLRFLMVQISLQCPRLIVTLGLHVPPMLATLSPDLACWTGPTVRLTDLDANPILKATIELGNGRFHRAVVVPIAHPSLPNGSRRMPQGFSPGKRGESELIRAGWNAAVRC